MSTKVVRALRACGSRKMLTPLEMASVPGHGRAPVGERPQQEEGGDTEDRARRSRAQGAACPWPRARLGERSRRLAAEAEEDEHGHVGDEEVGGDGEHAPGLADPAEVAEGQDHDEGDRQGDGVAPEGRVRPR